MTFQTDKNPWLNRPSPGRRTPPPARTIRAEILNDLAHAKLLEDAKSRVLVLERQGLIRRAEPKAPQIPQDGQQSADGTTSPEDCKRRACANLEARAAT